jgi:hypothetical protein
MVIMMVMMVVVMVIMMVVIPIMMIAMILVVPVALVDLPSAVIVIIVRMGPVSSCIRRSLPPARDPNIPFSMRAPVPVDPNEALSRHRGARLIAQRGWWRTDIHPDLSKRRK